MENTLENKAKFFAQYWGTDYIYKNEWGTFKGNMSEKDSIYNFANQITSAYLELTPLSMISDEDAIEVANMDNQHYWVAITNHWNGKHISELVDMVKDRMSDCIMFRDVSEYLRSKGYALPFMGLSVEKQIEYGWVKLKN